ncbi:hypothetical protein ACH4K7_00700 [Streptomyces globisporus]|uniref:hypothetical protein n=1 Tax=Streptomyces globisporus TaxID=1908 RepID=UPI003796051C
MFPDGPQRYVGTVFDDTYCRNHGLLDHPPAEDPDEITRSEDRVVTRWTRCTHVTDPLAVGTKPLDAQLLAEAGRWGRCGCKPAPSPLPPGC